MEIIVKKKICHFDILYERDRILDIKICLGKHVKFSILIEYLLFNHNHK